MMKRLMSMLLVMSLILALTPAVTMAANDKVQKVVLTIDAPVVGETPSDTASVPKNASTYVKKVEWTGVFNRDGNFRSNQPYTVHITLGIKKGINRTFDAFKMNNTINGKAAATEYLDTQTRTILILKYTFPNLKVPEGQVDTDAYYSMAEADRFNCDLGPTTVVMDETTMSENVMNTNGRGFLSGYSVQEKERITRIILNFPDPDPDIIRAVYNLKEVWLGPQVNVKEFMDAYRLDMKDYRYTSGNMNTWNCLFLVPDTQLPNGLNAAYDTDPEIGTIYMYGDSRALIARTKVYSGDVYAAAQKGADAARDWCPGHVYTALITTADRFMRHPTCQQTGQYYYSCACCGKCEYKPGHTFYRDYTGAVSGGQTEPNASKENAMKATVDQPTVRSFAVPDKIASANMSGWAENDANWAAEHGLIDSAVLGGDYTQPVNRMQITFLTVKLAERMTGKPIEPAAAGTFTDTDSEYALKASAAGIITDAAFEPGRAVTRQEMATFFYRALQYVKANSNTLYTPYTSGLGNYTDAGQVADWAVEPMSFMNALGLVSGTSATALSPNDSCSIEQAVVTANRSLDADKIGWYQAITADEVGVGNWTGGNNNRAYCYGLSAYMNTHTDYCGGKRIWVTGSRIGGKALSQSYYPTPDPYTGQTLYVIAENWKPIKDITVRTMPGVKTEAR